MNAAKPTLCVVNDEFTALAGVLAVIAVTATAGAATLGLPLALP